VTQVAKVEPAATPVTDEAPPVHDRLDPAPLREPVLRERPPVVSAPLMVPVDSGERTAILWPLLIVALMAGVGIGYWWRDPAPLVTQTPMATVGADPMSGTDVAVQDVPAGPEAPGTTAPAGDAAAATAAETRGRVLVRSVPTIELRPAGASTGTGTLDISTRPAGARVTLDGKLLGQAPMRVPGVLPGSHTIRLEMAGYRTVTTTVVVRAGQQVPVRVSLEVM
jgi:hypothetical protein